MEVVELGGGGVSELAGLLSGKPVVHEVGDEEQGIRDVPQRRVFQGEELVESVYPHKLYAGPLVDLLLRHLLEGSLYHPLRAGVAMVVGVGDENALPVGVGAIR